MEVERPGLESLAREECLRLLATARVGRVGFHAGALPVVLPVSFALDGGRVVFRVAPGSRLDGAVQGAVVAFEADDVDPAGGQRWSVTATGVAQPLARADEAAAARSLPVGPWGSGDADRVVAISLDLVEGRRSPVGSDGPEPVPLAADGGPVAVAETHSGVVLFAGDRAYKLKKALDLGFLDFRSREARLAACRREVVLNRRLAPDVYLGVADVVDADGRLCDHLVVMRRMPDDRRLSTLVATGAPVREHLDRLARVLAAFHERAVTSPAVEDAAGREAGLARWEANDAGLQPFLGRPLDGAAVAEVLALARRYLAGREPLFHARVAAGRARDGHGDLLADDIFCLDDGPRVLDCLEFDDRLRYGDVLADVAFLAMDLERLRRPDLAAWFLGRYRSAAADAWPPSLADHYVAYRAQVRAKVACLRWAQGDTASRAAAVHLLRLCQEHLRRARVRLVLVGGLPGSGKSTVAQGLADRLGALVLRSDEVRKELAGPAPSPGAEVGLELGMYRPEVTDATYEALLARARTALALGHTVVLDATWRHPGWRTAAARLAAEVAAELVELRCTVPIEVAVDRVGRRLLAGTDPSDASPAIARALAPGDLTWTTAHAVDTAGEPAAAVAAAVALVAGDDGLGPPDGGGGPPGRLLDLRDATRPQRAKGRPSGDLRP